MMIVRLIGGLGNQLFQYAVAKHLSMRNNIPLKIDVSCFAQLEGREYKLNHYQITDPVASQAEVDNFVKYYDSNTLFARLYRKLQNRKPKYKRAYYKEGGYWQYEPALMKITRPVFLEGFWQHHRYFQEIDPQVLNFFTLKPEYLPRDFPLLRKIQQNKGAVSLHIRRGDYVSDSNNLRFFGIMPLEYYHKAVAYINERVSNPIYYVFSDDLDWVRSELKLEAPMVFVDIDGGTRDYLELYAMSQCRHHIIANSSFSWWGAYLNKNADKIVIAPQKWVAVEELNERIEIQMPSWIKM